MDKKKLAAAIAAVFAYIRTSEEAAAGVAFQDHAALADPVVQQVVQEVIRQITPVITRQVAQMMASQPANTWGTSGRQIQMQDNSLMQKRTFK